MLILFIASAAFVVGGLFVLGANLSSQRSKRLF
jgi:hypothetical protein